MPIIYLAIFAIFLFQNLAISAFTTYYYSLTLSLGDMPIRPLCLFTITHFLSANPPLYARIEKETPELILKFIPYQQVYYGI